MFGLPRKIDALLALIVSLLTRSSAVDMEKLMMEFCAVFDYNSTFLVGLVQLSKKDYRMLAQFAERFGTCNVDTVHKFTSLLSHLTLLTARPQHAAPSSLKILSKANVPGAAAAAAAGAGATALSTNGKSMPAGLAGLSYKELFQVARSIHPSSPRFPSFFLSHH